MLHAIHGLHHITATVDGAQEDLDFYIGLLGLRLVKKTVNFDNHRVYHFYYGDRVGTPGTIMTTFPYRGHKVRVGEKGTGQVVTSAFSIPVSALDFWQERLATYGMSYTSCSRFGEPVLSFSDPASLNLELIGTHDDRRRPWTTASIGTPNAVQGLHGVTLSLKHLDQTMKLLSDTLGFTVIRTDENRTRLEVGQGGPGRSLDLLHEPNRPLGKNGLGTVHHIAFAVETDEAQQQLREDLMAMGYEVTEIRDRKYFRSIYFREPGGALIEVATMSPGFSVDEPIDSLGLALKLPPGEEPNRTRIEGRLPKVLY
jgi:glyoxalase family protein